MDQLIAEIRKIPPITRFLCASSLGVTVPVLLKFIPPYRFLFIWESVTWRFEIWRVFTSFFLGDGGINYLFEFAMLYRTADQLESGSYPTRPADLAWQLVLVGGSIIVACLPLGAYVFTRPFLLALTYLSSALAPPGARTSLMGLFVFPVRYLPYMMIAMDFLIGGPNAAAQAIAGAIVGHFWWWTMWATEGGQRPALESFGRAPAWMKAIVGEPAAGALGPGIQVVPPRRPTTGGSTGYNWGSGRRLGT